MTEHQVDVTDPAVEDAYQRVIEPVDPVAVIVTCAAGGHRAGCLVTFNAPCSIEPPRYAVWLAHRNYTYRVALRARELVVHMLTHADLPLAELFGGVSGMYEDKFARVPWSDCSGAPLLRVSGGWLRGPDLVARSRPGGDGRRPYVFRARADRRRGRRGEQQAAPAERRPSHPTGTARWGLAVCSNCDYAVAPAPRSTWAAPFWASGTPAWAAASRSASALISPPNRMAMATRYSQKMRIATPAKAP
jgi:hypothetical protein